MAKKAKPDSKALQHALSEHPAPQAGGRTPNAEAGGGIPPANDAPPPEAKETEAAETNAAASGTAAAVEGNRTPPAAANEFMTIAFPLPEGIPPQALLSASIVIKARPANGRWRAGRKFTREETVFPFGDLTGQEVAALTCDPELIVSLRVPKPA
jgi:hypothetical protein